MTGHTTNTANLHNPAATSLDHVFAKQLRQHHQRRTIQRNHALGELLRLQHHLARMAESRIVHQHIDGVALALDVLVQLPCRAWHRQVDDDDVRVCGDIVTNSGQLLFVSAHEDEIMSIASKDVRELGTDAAAGAGDEDSAFGLGGLRQEGAEGKDDEGGDRGDDEEGNVQEEDGDAAEDEGEVGEEVDVDIVENEVGGVLTVRVEVVDRVGGLKVVANVSDARGDIVGCHIDVRMWR